MLFQLKMVYQKEDLYALAKVAELNHTLRRGWPLIPKSVAIMLYGFCSLVGGAVILKTTVLGEWPLYLLAIGILLLLVSLFFGLFLLLNISGRLTWRNYSAKGTEALLEFFEDYFATYLPTAESRTSYTVIQKLFEDQARYFLFVNKNSAVIVRKDGFTVGDPAEFGAWIAEKTGEEITKLR